MGENEIRNLNNKSLSLVVYNPNQFSIIKWLICYIQYRTIVIKSRNSIPPNFIGPGLVAALPQRVRSHSGFINLAISIIRYIGKSEANLP